MNRCYLQEVALLDERPHSLVHQVHILRCAPSAIPPADCATVSCVGRVWLLFFGGGRGERGVVCARGECRLVDGGGRALPVVCELS
jgi:hypothetical protein